MHHIATYIVYCLNKIQFLETQSLRRVSYNWFGSADFRCSGW